MLAHPAFIRKLITYHQHPAACAEILCEIVWENTPIDKLVSSMCVALLELSF
jgi:hypothetical protein